MNYLISNLKKITNLKKYYRKCNLNLSKGMTFLEVLIAIAVAGTGLALMSTIFSGTSDTHMRGNDLVVGSLLGQSKMEEIIQKGYKGILKDSKTFDKPSSFYEDGNIVNDKFRWTASITEQERDLIKIKVQVLWPWPKNSKHIEYSTLLTDRN